MRPFEYTRAHGLDRAAQLMADGGRPIAGGTNLLDLMKLEVETPSELIDINRLPLGGIEADGDGLRIGALVSNSACAGDLRIRRDYPVLARAILAGATFQLRNKATTAGNLCQRTRCNYFYNIDTPCNKREPGSGCGAIGGFNRIHAILGASQQCIATYPGDMAVALAALNAIVEIARPGGGTRNVPVRDFHRLPGDTPQHDNMLEPGDIITAVVLPAPAGGRQLYRKVRERSSYAFALVSIAAVVRMDGETIGSASLAFGGLAHKPWHDPRIDELLSGAKPSDALFDEAADLLLETAIGYGDNDFKIPLARRTLKAVLREATGAAA
ncbi:xanthine dehydrogenase YagS FAD-binding subunit [Rhodopseudomonas thermotolerans]|uniref:Xanthine dehydrogenase YagS FAD-binding subunit n=2 Tax=Rhodopseudomonas TaxID=1073 RepID=A0A336JNG4_9BRAD|nr:MULTISPECIES: xanthine dehydrogenase family protein subunit M [Rhodopseudomonas]RED33231.1 xanthine dehydrogenase YagS FAD-binding subunit [Rhodopseudomonas pentothenatexigens]REF93980.1 xanthine dehydrogenase YagS FAD-binding subunit [Rhodopseudomonas thermotolerans]SSW91307.1 xanthine dehydrogenase YagS FAD-binding subunit [Rhodopseudomonas pentothenatexigens]